jgi:hypothetical protein
MSPQRKQIDEQQMNAGAEEAHGLTTNAHNAVAG